MPDFITLSCPSCGHKLEITEDVDRFACAACGNEHIVSRSGGMVSLKPVIDRLDGVKVGVDKTASELAIVRLNNEIKVLQYQISVINQKRDSLPAPISSPKFFTYIFIFLIFVGVSALLYLLISSYTTDGVYSDALLYIIIALMSFILARVLFSKVKDESNVTKRDKEQYRREIEQHDRNIDEEEKQVRDVLRAKTKELSEHHYLVSKYK